MKTLILILFMCSACFTSLQKERDYRNKKVPTIVNIQDNMNPLHPFIN